MEIKGDLNDIFFEEVTKVLLQITAISCHFVYFNSENKATVSKSSEKSAKEDSKDSAKLVNRNPVEAISEKREIRER